MKKNNSNGIDVLLVDDDPADVKLTKRVLEKSKLSLNIHVAEDGVQALSYLRQEGQYSASPRPDLILLDLNLPKKGGIEVLEDVRKDPELKNIPVVILTTSEADEDVARSYELNANCYVTKPVDLHQFSKVVQSIEDFWLTVVRLPKE